MKFSEFLLLEKDEVDAALDTNTDVEKDKPKEEPSKEEPKEEPVKEEPKTFKDIFDANKSNVKTFSRSELFDARQLEEDEVFKAKGRQFKAKSGQYFLRNHVVQGKIKIINAKTFASEFESVRPNDRKDSEGYVLVRPVGKVEAFEYSDDSQEIIGQDKEKVTLSRGMMIVRNEGDDTTGWTLTKNEFAQSYK